MAQIAGMFGSPKMPGAGGLLFGPDEAEAAISAPWAGGVASGFAGGSGTEDDPYLIATAEQLAYLAKTVNDGTTYDGEHFRLTADIDLGGRDDLEWIPIGIGDGSWPPANYFGGAFDGDRHEVTRMRIISSDYYPNDDGLRYAGLFGLVSGDVCEIRNVGVTDFVISVDRLDGYITAGGLAACVQKGDITLAYASGTVAAYTAGWSSNAGGLVGLFDEDGAITASYSTGSVSSSAPASYAVAGGLVGYLYGALVSSFSACDVVSFTDHITEAGGLAGGFNYSSKVLDSYAIGDVEAIHTAASSTNTLSGGLIGSFEDVDVYGDAILATSYAWGAVSADAAASRGGLIGGTGYYYSRKDNIKSNDWRQDSGAGGVNAGLNAGVGLDRTLDGPIEQSVHARSRDVLEFGSAYQSEFEARGWDFERVWCYTSLDNGARPHIFTVVPNDITVSAGEMKYARLFAEAWTKSVDQNSMTFTPGLFCGVDMIQHPTSPDVIVFGASGLTHPGTTDVSVGFSVDGSLQVSRTFTLNVLPHPDYRSADILAISADIGGTAYTWQQQNDETTWLRENVPADADLSNVDLNVELYMGATVTNTKGHDLDEPVELTVTATDGTTKKTHTVLTHREDPDNPDVPAVILDALPEHSRAVLTLQDDGTYAVDIYIPFDVSFDPSEIESIYVDALNITIVRLHWLDENGDITDIPHRQAGTHELHIEGTVANRHTLADVVIKNIYVRLKSNPATRYVQELNMNLSKIPGGIPVDPDDPHRSGGGVGCATGAGMLALVGLGAVMRRRPAIKCQVSDIRDKA